MRGHTFYLQQYSIRYIFYQIRIGIVNISNKSRYTNLFTTVSTKKQTSILSIFFLKYQLIFEVRNVPDTSNDFMRIITPTDSKNAVNVTEESKPNCVSTQVYRMSKYNIRKSVLFCDCYL